MLLNGWRRLGIVLTGIWVVGVGVLLAVELAHSKTGVFVYQTIPKGTLIQGDKATLPDGSVVQLNAQDAATGHSLKPWEINWDNEADILKGHAIRWDRLAIFGIAVPACVWLLVELLVCGGRWILRGFRSTR